MAAPRAGSRISREFPTFDSTSQNADADELPVGVLLYNGVATDAAVTVTRVGTGLYVYTVLVPSDAVSGASIQIRMTATVDGREASDIIDEFTVAAGCLPSDGTCSPTYDPAASDIDDLAIIRPETASFEGCQIFDKLRALVMSKGSSVTVEWQLLRPNGRPISLIGSTDSVSESADAEELSIQVYFSGCAGCSDPIAADGSIYDETCGVVRFDVPNAVADEAGIYQVQIGVMSSLNPGRPKFIQTGLLSVERSAWGLPAADSGPPTLNEIRTAIRDNATENVYSSAVEYSTDEVFYAIIQPIREWNETPPPIAYFSCKNFPYKFYWMRAIVAELMRIAAQHYLRNKLQTSAAGMNINDMDKNDEYMKLSELYRQEWKAFVEHKKVQLNIGRSYGTLGSAYGHRVGAGFW